MCRGTGPVVTWRRAQVVLLPAAQGMDAARTAGVPPSSEDRVRDVIRNFNADGWQRRDPGGRGAGGTFHGRPVTAGHVYTIAGMLCAPSDDTGHSPEQAEYDPSYRCEET
ncbi:MAG TPA: hypothetical protein VGS19_35930 [Streptosporangiaceae bacterium]|nr:hypothetical protein [Streptosporangiaceae bacterium]